MTPTQDHQLQKGREQLQSIKAAISGLNKNDTQQLRLVVDLRSKFFQTIEALDAEVKRELRSEFPSVRTELDLARFITQDTEMISLKKDVIKMVDSEYPVLITGETGTGKELLAKALHGDRQGKFIDMNCAALPTELISSELFGHRKGAFTGADNDRVGAFQAAANGTLFLDEIGDMNLDLQSKLLRAIQEKKIRRLGDNFGDSYTINCRIVCATHRDLNRMVREGLFRLDLLKRLEVLTLHTKPLRDRRQDMVLILKSLGMDTHIPNADLNDVIINDPLLGNVRDLESMVVRWKVLGRI